MIVRDWKTFRQTDEPYGALALSVAAVERALKRFKTGQYVRGNDKFNQEMYGKSTCSYLRTIINLREATWAKINNSAMEYAKSHRIQMRGSVRAVLDVDDDGSEDERLLIDDSSEFDFDLDD